MDNVFFNYEAKEFVTRHMIAGIRGKNTSAAVECEVIVDHELYMERSANIGRLADGSNVLSLDGLVFFIKKSVWLEHFDFIPNVRAALIFDGKRYLIEALNDDFGFLDFTLSGMRG